MPGFDPTEPQFPPGTGGIDPRTADAVPLPGFLRVLRWRVIFGMDWWERSTDESQMAAVKRTVWLGRFPRSAGVFLPGVLGRVKVRRRRPRSSFDLAGVLGQPLWYPSEETCRRLRGGWGCGGNAPLRVGGGMIRS